MAGASTCKLRNKRYEVRNITKQQSVAAVYRSKICKLQVCSAVLLLPLISYFLHLTYPMWQWSQLASLNCSGS